MTLMEKADSKQLTENENWIESLPENLKAEMSCVKNELSKSSTYRNLKELPALQVSLRVLFLNEEV